MSVKKALAGGACSLALVTASFFGIVTDKVRISQEGLENLINCEGCKRQSYKDVAGVPTAGVGSTIGIVMGRLYTDGEVAKMLAKDVIIAEQCLNRNVKVDLNQGEWDAYVSFVFNVGCSAFVSSTTYRILNGVKPGTRIQACQAMGMWNKITVNGVKVFSQGVYNRRVKDIALCVKYM
ncbi:lysin [Erwinia phage VyarbaL]|nr:lysin [Erwinia phage VyarbaL]